MFGVELSYFIDNANPYIKNIFCPSSICSCVASVVSIILHTNSTISLRTSNCIPCMTDVQTFRNLSVSNAFQ